MEYKNRIADQLLRDKLEAMGAVLIEGPKACGKTTTAEQQAKSIIYMDDPTKQQQYKQMAQTNISFLLEGETPRLIDEWQEVPQFWDAIRFEVDHRGKDGQFMLTGSAVPADTKDIHHTGTGRYGWLTMRPMSLWESQESTGEVSLKELFNNPDYDIDGKMSKMTVEELIFAASRGGWPASLLARTPKAQLLVAKNYVQTICSNDISSIDGKKRDARLTSMILRAYARNVSTLVKKKSLLDDVTSSGEVSCHVDTFDDYVAALEKLFVIQNISAWCPAIRSKTAIRSGVKRCFCDPSIPIALLGLSPEALSMQLKTFGFIFEQMCIRDLKAYTMDLNSHVSYYHDRYDLEADIVLHLEDGRYALIECKLGSREIDDGAKHLLELKRLIQEHNTTEKQMPIREPDLLIVMTGGSMAYTRQDGVKVIPLACLKD